MRPFATALSATPPARQRFVEAVRRCASRTTCTYASSSTPCNAPPPSSCPSRSPPPRPPNVLVPLREPRDRLAGRSEHLFEARREDAADRRWSLLPRHVDAAIVVREVVEVQLVEAAGADEVAHASAVHGGVAVRGQPHDLPLVAVIREAEPLRHRGVVDAERVREHHSVEDLEAVAAPDREQCRGEVAEA